MMLWRNTLTQGVSVFLPVPHILHICLNGRQPQKLSPFISVNPQHFRIVLQKLHSKSLFQVKHMNFSEEAAVF